MAYESEHSLSTGQPNNTIGTANILNGGVSTTGALSSASDVDYYKIDTTGPSLISLNFLTGSSSSSNLWNLSLLDSAGSDYLVSPTRSVTGSPLVDGASQADNTLDVKGLSSLPAAGSRFTIATSGADTTIYTVVSATALSAGTTTLTLDKATASPADGASLVFDPVQSSVGLTTSLSALVEAAGTYYFKVAKADVASTQEYAVTTTVTSTIESDANDTAADAADTNNHLLSGVAMTGSLSSDVDKDVWLFTTAVASDFKIDFAAASGSAASNDWKITVTDWNGQAIRDSNGTAISLAAGTSATTSLTQLYNATAKTYAVTVEAAKAGASTSNYTLKVSGTALDLNDTPVMTIGSVSSSASNTVIDTAVVKSIQAGADSSLSLSSLFTVSDADATQTHSYIVSLAKPSGSGSTGYIKVGDTSYGFGSGMTSPYNLVLSSSQMASAKFYAGASGTGDMTLTLQARDSSGASDGSDYGAFMQQTLRVVDAGYSVLVGAHTLPTLQEGNSSSSDTLSVTLGKAPATGETVTVYLEHDSEASNAFQLSYSSSTLSFNSTNWDQAQSVTVTAREDGVKETTQTGILSFRVTSSDATSAFNDLNVDNLSYSLIESANHAPTGSVTLSGTATQGQVLTAANTLADTDGIGIITYTWEQSLDNTTWSTVTGSGNSSTYTLLNAQVANYIRVVANYTDALANAESVTSSSLSSSGSAVTVSNVNDAPTVANAITDQNAYTGGVYSFTFASDTFNDVDPVSSGGRLTYTSTQEDGSPLPSWLAFNASTHTFSSISDLPIAGTTLNVKVTATDSGSPALSVSDVFAITVNSPVSGTPVLSHALVDQTAVENTLLSYIVTPGSFTDTDALTYTATLADGADLPTWLTFNGTDALVFSGTPGSADIGTLSVKLTASDGTLSNSDIFNIVVRGVNDAFDLSGSVKFWKTNALVADVTSTLGSDSDSTAVDGLFHHLSQAYGNYTLSSAKVSGAAETTAIKAADALAALKISVGINPNADASAVSPYQYLAADINKDGSVKAADALNILKMAVNYTGAPAKEWFFVEDSVGSETMTKSSVIWPSSDVSVTLDHDQELHLVGILKGDVNGSWVPPA